MIKLVHIALLHSLALPYQLVKEEEATKAITADEGKKVEVGDARGRGEEELDYHVVGATSGDIREDEVEGDGGQRRLEKGRETKRLLYIQCRIGRCTSI